jgi:molybdate transport system regulatory protein
MRHAVYFTLTKEATMKLGARNQLKGTVKQIKKGSIMCQITVDLDPKGRMSSVCTLDSLKELGIKKGDKVSLIAKAVNVLVVKE